MALFHFLSAGRPLIINCAPQTLRQNLSLIEDLITYPPQSKLNNDDTIEARAHEKYPLNDSCEDSRRLDVVGVGAILNHPDLVKETVVNVIIDCLKQINPRFLRFQSTDAIMYVLGEFFLDILELFLKLNMKRTLYLIKHRLNEFVFGTFELFLKLSSNEW